MPMSDGRTDARRQAEEVLRSARRIFVIYTSSDLTLSRDLRRRIIRLRAERTGEHVFLAADSLGAGDDVSRTRIAEELAAADLAVVACGELTALSAFVADEVAQALRQRREGQTKILPIILTVGVSLPAGLDYSVHAVHLTTLFPAIRWKRIGVAAAIVLLAAAAGVLQLRSMRTVSAAQEQTARQLWERAVVARDNGRDPVTATHMFAEAADMTVDPLSDANAAVAIDDAIGGGRLEAIFEPDAPIREAAFDNDGARILTRHEDGTARLWDVSTRLPVRPVFKHGSGLAGAVWDPTERSILTWGNDGEATLRLWNATSGEAIGGPMSHAAATAAVEAARTRNPSASLMELSVCGGSVSGAKYNPTGSLVVSWCQSGGTIVVWDTRTQKPFAPVMTHLQVVAVMFHPRGDRIMTMTGFGHVYLWDVRTGTRIGREIAHPGLRGAAFGADGRKILTWGSDRKVRLWDADTQHSIGQPMEHENWVDGALLMDDQRRVMSWGADGAVRWWDVTTQQPVGPMLQQGSQIMEASLDRAQQLLLTYRSTGAFEAWRRPAGTADVWQVASGRQIGPTLMHRTPLWGAALSRDGRHVVTWSGDGTMRLWSVEPPTDIWVIKHGAAPIGGAAFDARQSRLLTWSDDGTARLWDPATREAVGDTMRHGAAITGATFSPDARYVLTWGKGGDLQLWDAAAGTRVGQPGRDRVSLAGAAFITAQPRILTWTGLGTLGLWHLSGDRLVPENADPDASGSDPHPLSSLLEKMGLAATQTGAAPFPMKHEGDILGATFDAARKRVLTWGYKEARLWDAAALAPIGLPMRHEGRNETVVAAAFADRETRIVTRGTDDTIRTWDTATGAPLGKIEHKGLAGAVLNRGTARMWSWSEDGLVQGWHSSTLESAASTIRTGERLAGIAVDPEGHRLLTWTGGIAKLWDTRTLDVIGFPMNHGQELAGALFTAAALATWSHDGVVRLWDYSTQKAFATWHLGPLTAATVESTSRRLVTWSADGSVRVLRLRATPTQPSGLRTLDVEVRTGTRLLPTGELEALSAKDWIDKQRQLQNSTRRNRRN